MIRSSMSENVAVWAKSACDRQGDIGIVMRGAQAFQSGEERAPRPFVIGYTLALGLFR
jgi:hypothetical protein